MSSSPIPISARMTPSNNPTLVLQVFSNPSLRSLIFRDVMPKQWMPILLVCQLFFVGGVETMYKNFDYQNYNKLIKRCISKDRLNAYLGAVRTVDLSKLTRTIQIAKWASILSSFPNASVIKRYHDILYRSLSSPVNDHEPEYTYSYPYSEELHKTTQKIPPPRPGIPKTWKQVRRITLNAYNNKFGDDKDGTRAEEWSKAFLSRMRDLNQPLEGISLGFPVPNKIVLDTLKEIKDMGLGTPKYLFLNSSDQDLFEILEMVSPTLTNLNIWKIKYEDCNISVRDFFDKIPWKKLRNLSIIKLSVKRKYDSEIGLDNDAGKSFHPAGNDQSKLEPGDIHLFMEFNFHLMYPCKDDQEFEAQLEIDLESMDCLARSFITLTNRLTGPCITTITRQCQSSSTDDLVKNQKYTGRLNERLRKEFDVIRQEVMEKELMKSKVT